MIKLKNNEQIQAMKKAGRIAGEALYLAGEAVKEGISTYEIDTIVRSHIVSQGAEPSFLGYGGFPASACISLNDEVIHGIPSKDRILKDGDVVKIDIGAFYHGFHGDNANTFTVGNVSDEAKKLIDVTRNCFYEAVKNAVDGNRLGDIGNAVESYATKNGFSVVRTFVGHGIGQQLHEPPEVANYGEKGKGFRLCTGMTIAIEPMINAGTHEVKVLDDEWTVVTKDSKLSAHYEHTIAITENGVVILTAI